MQRLDAAGTAMLRSPLLAAAAVGLVLASLLVGDSRPPPPPCAFADGPPSPSSVPTELTGAPRAPKGPVGWEAFRRLGDLPMLAVGTQARMFSSADPTGGNADGFRGAYLCRASDGYVIGEHVGPGQLTSLWFTRGDGDVSGNGRLRVELDGVAVVDAPLQDVVDGRLGAPFVHPLVANADQASGGAYIQVPMPFRRSMRVLTDRVPQFYRVQYEAFADPVGVSTFDPTDPARDVLERLRAAGSRPPVPAGPDRRARRRSVRLPPGGTLPPVQLPGPGTITALRLRLPRVSTLPQPGSAGVPSGGTAAEVEVDPANDGVQIVRRTQVRDAIQQVPVLVNEVAGPRSFDTPRPVPGGGFAQVLELPAEVTTDRARLLLSDVRPGPATLVVRSRVDGQWVVTDRVELPAPDPAPPDGHDPEHPLQDLHLRLSFDGRPTVDVPVGEFFGVGLGQRPVSALTFAVSADGVYRAWWPMPFAREASVSLHNASGAPVSGELQVVTEPGDRWGAELGPDGRAGYFHATARSGLVAPGRDWDLARLQGHGRVVGFTQTFRGRHAGRTYLEGDERVLVDGARSPQLHGTGTEDLYLAGWYFNRGPFSTPFSGHSAHLDGEGERCRFECDAVWRVLVADGLPFHRDLGLRMEHGVDNGFEAHYGSTTFWYGRQQPALQQTDHLDVGDRPSERRHDYSGREALRRLTTQYPGGQGEGRVTDLVRSTRGPVRFRMSVDPDNAGVLLRRRADQERGGQAAQVLVDGVDAGVWFQPEANPVRRWLDDDLLLPAALTRGKRAIELTLRPLAGAPPWTAARYQALSLLGPVVDGASDGVTSGRPAATPSPSP